MIRGLHLIGSPYYLIILPDSCFSDSLSSHHVYTFSKTHHHVKQLQTVPLVLANAYLLTFQSGFAN